MCWFVCLGLGSRLFVDLLGLGCIVFAGFGRIVWGWYNIASVGFGLGSVGFGVVSYGLLAFGDFVAIWVWRVCGLGWFLGLVAYCFLGSSICGLLQYSFCGFRACVCWVWGGFCGFRA